MSKYSIISQKRRLQLIDLVKKQKKTIVSAAKKLKIKISTAKSILYSFQKNGKVLKKKKHQKVDRSKDSMECHLQDSVQNNGNSHKEQVKKQEENDEQMNIPAPNMCPNPFLVMNPPLMNPLWNYYQYCQAFNRFPMLNGNL